MQKEPKIPFNPEQHKSVYEGLGTAKAIVETMQDLVSKKQISIGKPSVFYPGQCELTFTPAQYFAFALKAITDARHLAVVTGCPDPSELTEAFYEGSNLYTAWNNFSSTLEIDQLDEETRQKYRALFFWGAMHTLNIVRGILAGEPAKLKERFEAILAELEEFRTHQTTNPTAI